MTPRIFPSRLISVLCAAVLATVVLVGCSSPSSRINENLAKFEQLSPEDQQFIREGKIALGFDMEMVELALGRPNRKWMRTDASGSSESWSYTTYETYGGVAIYRGFYHRYYGDPLYPYFGGSFGGQKEREYFKVIFQEGKVTEIESESR